MGLYEETLIQHDYIEIREADVLPDNLDGVWVRRFNFNKAWFIR